jgi:hypothetical protein
VRLALADFQIGRTCDRVRQRQVIGQKRGQVRALQRGCGCGAVPGYRETSSRPAKIVQQHQSESPPLPCSLSPLRPDRRDALSHFGCGRAALCLCIERFKRLQPNSTMNSADQEAVSISFFVHRVGFPKKSANSKARIPSENAHGSEQTQ